MYSGKYIAGLLFGFSSLFLIGCGGSGTPSNSDVNPNPPTTTPTNQSPTVNTPISNQEHTVGTSYMFDVAQGGQTFADPDGDTLSYSIEIEPVGSGLISNGSIISGTPLSEGNINVSVAVNDPGGLTASTSFTITITTPVNASNRKNILLLIADDLGQDSSNQYQWSSNLPSTPTLDQLAAQGLVFENLWVNPTCTPTRSSIFTGKYGTRTNVITASDVLDPSETSLAQTLKSHPATADFTMAKIGKWHLGGGPSRPEEFGLDYYAGILNGAVPSYFDWTLTTNNQTYPQTEYATTVLTDLAIDWVSEQTSPWVLWIGFNAPHTPFHLPPANLHSRNLSGDAQDIADNPREYYLAAIEALDTEIARLLNSFDQSTRDNTVIIFIGDNGTPSRVRVRNSALSGNKGDISEGGIRVPMVVSGSGVSRQGERESALINGSDFFSTILALAGQPESAIHDSVPFTRLLHDNNTPHIRNTSFSQNTLGYTIRNERYKLIEYLDNTRALYDLDNDISEENNLFDYTAPLPNDLYSLDSLMSSITEDGWIVNKHNERSSYMMEGSDFIPVNVIQTQASLNSYTVTSNAIPNYKVVVTDEVLNVLRSRPDSAFVDGHSLTLDDSVTFGQDIGMNATCAGTGGDGWWPQSGSSCPISQDGMMLTFPQDPLPGSSECETGLGPVGMWVNGVPIYNWSDASSYENQGVWNNFAEPFRSAAMDLCNGHAGNGMYHHHSYNACLKQQLGDEGNMHSPVYGYAGDGYPIHGPYHAQDVLTKSCWKKRDYSQDSSTGCGSNGVRNCRFVDEENIQLGIVEVPAGPNTSDTISFFRAGNGQAVSGIFYEDFYYDSECTEQGDEYLDEHNGHDHDGLGYHYHTSVDESLTPVFPLVHGPDYYGELTNSSFQCFRRTF